eukprot:g6732.t1
MSSRDSSTSALQDERHSNESGFDLRLQRLMHQQELSFMMLSRETSSSNPGSFGLRHQALEELTALARVFRPMFGGDRDHRSFTNDFYSDDMLDPDNMTYEELRALSESVGSVNKGLCSSIISSIPTRKYSKKKNCDHGDEQCTICRYEFEEKVPVKELPCGHCFHPSCIDQWLEISKKCPICSTEVEYGP